MPEIVHIVFEKLTGLKGTIEGDFIRVIDNFYQPDKTAPIIYIGETDDFFELAFTQLGNLIFLRPVDVYFAENYREHFLHGINFLIKEWSYGGGVRINSQNPN